MSRFNRRLEPCEWVATVKVEASTIREQSAFSIEHVRLDSEAVFVCSMPYPRPIHVWGCQMGRESDTAKGREEVAPKRGVVESLSNQT